MKKQELIKRSIYIISEYYKNHFEPFFDAIADDVLWFGPRAGQVFQGKEAIIKAWNREQTDLQFTMGNIEAMSTSTGTNNLEVMLEYYVYTHFPNGRTDCHHQRLHYSWGGRTEPKVYMIHLSNITGGNDFKIYADSQTDSAIDALQTDIYPSRTIYGKGNHGILYYFNSASVLYIESTDASRHSAVHTTDGTYATKEPLRYYEAEYGDVLLRAHTSYLINPTYVRSVRRFTVTLADGTVIPIPEKKYTAFREELNQRKAVRKSR